MSSLEKLNIEPQQPPITSREVVAVNANQAQFFSRRNLLALMSVAAAAIGGSSAMVGTDTASAASPSVETPQATATSTHKSNLHPKSIKDRNGNLIACPDPTVLQVSYRNYRLACTSNNSEANGKGHKKAAITEYKSNDLIHWTSDGYIFPEDDEPSWALPTNGTGKGGEIWAPELDKINGRYVVYFAARVNPSAVLYDATGQRMYMKPNTMVIGEADSASIDNGDWYKHTRVVTFPGQFNSVPGAPQQVAGGEIDPSQVYDPATKQNLLFWTEQPLNTYEGILNQDGTQLIGPIRRIPEPLQPWQCASGMKYCIDEGGSATIQNGILYRLFSGGSTWGARGDQYAVGVDAVPAAQAMTGQFVERSGPILSSSPGFADPGGESKPVTAPNGTQEIFVHMQPTPKHSEMSRFLASTTINFGAGGSVTYPPQKGQEASAPSTQPYAIEPPPTGPSMTIPWPLIGNGHLKPSNVLSMSSKLK
ncbi:MAG TPA: family 43 glycosylhydrolase [Candidatus Saccharimonadales bacterium]|jgi:hypothetical protein|nr:family 43 glycosylhydrolase [Candidatus Saccharimonadales bacterium]